MGSEDVEYEIASRSGRLWYVVVALVLGLRTAGACTVLELTGAGFAANAVHVLHAYTLFAHNNGTMYINSTAFEYKCSSVGGWHDFFTFDGLNGTVADIASMPPGESCARYEFHDIDLMLKSLSYGWWFVDQAAAKKVCLYALLCLICCSTCSIQSVSSSGSETSKLQLSVVRCTLFLAGLSAD